MRTGGLVQETFPTWPEDLAGPGSMAATLKILADESAWKTQPMPALVACGGPSVADRRGRPSLSMLRSGRSTSQQPKNAILV